MSTDQNKAIVHRIFDEVVNKGNLGVADELLAADYVNHDFPAPAPGAEGFKLVATMFRSAFPDIVVTFEDELAEGDKVVTRGRFEGTHKGEFMGIPATGRRVSIKYLDIWRLENGKCKENWVQMDLLGLMQQLGVIPAPGQATT
jgi:predicted ester cyclase